MNKKTTFATAAAALSLLVIVPACKPEAQQNTARDDQQRRAREAANSLRFNDNAEIENIRRRLEITGNPNQLGYIVLMNAAGQPIMYEGVMGKVTSGGKRLTEPDRVVYYSNANGQAWVNRAAPSDEGTFGSSTPYIFYWNSDGVYRQWSGDYLYSTQPMRLQTQPLVINIAAPPAPPPGAPVSTAPQPTPAAPVPPPR